MNHDLVNSHFWLVKSVARRVSARLPKHVRVEDLISAGSDGLMQASESFSLTGGANFATFASKRIKGAIYDWVRVEYGARGKKRIRALSFTDAETEEFNNSLAKKDKEWHKDPIYFKYDPFRIVSAKDGWEYIKRRALVQKGHQGDRLIDDYYRTNASLNEISKQMQVTESRVSQIHSHIIARYAVMISMGLMNKDVFYV
jgi:RNA polymerase sigma factor (sigma-70 family)